MPSLALACRLSAVSRASRRPFSPASLFSSGEQGVWYDPSDFSTLFQDAAGTTPVTAVEQPVGLILDKSGRGNHAMQTTTTSRPVLSARVNLLTGTETLATQTVTTRATTQTLRFEGAGTVMLSGTATGTYSAGSHSVTTTAGNLTLTVSGTVTKADLHATNIGVGLPAYQRVNTATDYDTQGFPYYLRFDGVDDYLVTNSIDFTGTDKMTVVAGVRKLTVSASSSPQIILELSTGFNFCSFAVTSDDNWAARFMFYTKGTLPAHVSSTNYPIAITKIVTGIGDISGDSAILRVDGTQAASSTADQGTGNYGNYPLYIGRRGGTMLPFNGQLYGLVIRGALSSTGEIQGSESYMNLHTGAY